MSRALTAEVGDCSRCKFLSALSETQQKELEFFQENSDQLSDLTSVLGRFADTLSLKPTDISQPVQLETLALDLKEGVKLQTGPLDAQKAEHLRTLLIGLNEKLKAMQLLIHEVFLTRNQLKASRASQEGMQDSVKRAADAHRAEIAKFELELKRLGNDRTELATVLQDTREELQTELQRGAQLNSALEIAESSLAKLNTDQQNFEHLRQHIGALQTSLTKAEATHNDLRNNFEKRIKAFEADIQEKDRLLQAISQEKAAVADVLQKTSTDLKGKTSQCDALNKEKMTLASAVTQLNAEKHLEGDLLKLINELEGLKEEQAAQLEHISNEFDFAICEFEAKTENLAKLNEGYQDKAVKLEDILEKTEAEMDTKQTAFEEQQKVKFELAGKVATLEQTLCVNEDQQDILDAYTEKLKQSEAFKSQLTKELGFTSDYLLAQSSRALKAVKATTKLGEILDEREHEIDVLREVVNDLKKRTPTAYHAARVRDRQDDPIDQALAEFINNRDIPLDIPFTREDPGVYLFGTKRVFVKLENGKIISKA